MPLERQGKVAVAEIAVEATADDGRATGAEDLLDAGARWRPPRWLWLGAAIALLVGIGVLAANRHDPSRTARAVAPTPHRPTGVTQLPDVPATGPSARDVVMFGADTWVLGASTLQVVDEAGNRRTIQLSAAELAGIGGTSALVPDPVKARVWLVGGGARSSRIIEFDAATLRRIRDVGWHETVDHAAVLDGHLFLSSEDGVADLAPAALRPRFIPGLLGAVGPIAADLTRDRLVILDLGFPTAVWTYRPGEMPVEAPHFLRFTDGTVEVVDGAIWVGGVGPAGAVLVRLDPHALTPIAASPVTAALGAGAHMVAAGSRVLWVRSTREGEKLWCVDARTGIARQSWNDVPGPVASQFLPAPITSRAATAVVVSAGVMQSLVLTACAG